MESSITPKTASATAGAGASTPLSILLIWLIEMIPTHTEPFHVVVSATIAAAIASIMASVAAFAGAWIAPRSEPTPEQVTQILTTHAEQKQFSTTQNGNYSQPTIPL